jgi:hypothetical protein
MFKKKVEMIRPRISPDPRQAEALEKRLQSVSYVPELGFHRDRIQQRVQPLPKAKS